MIKKLASHLGEYRRAAILTPMFSALEAVMDILLPTIMAFIIDLGIEKGDMNAIVKYGLLTFGHRPAAGRSGRQVRRRGVHRLCRQPARCDV